MPRGTTEVAAVGADGAGTVVVAGAAAALLEEEEEEEVATVAFLFPLPSLDVY